MTGTNGTKRPAVGGDERARVLARLRRAVEADRWRRVVLAGSSAPAPPGAHDPGRPRIFLILAGCRHVQIARGGRVRDEYVRAGELLFCASGSWHAVMQDRRHVLISLIFDAGSMSATWKASPGEAPARRCIAPARLAGPLRYTLAGLGAMAPENCDAGAAMSLARALLRLSLDHIAQPVAPPGRAEQTLQAVREYLEDHYAQPIGRDAVAEALGLHPNHVSRLFRERTGETFSVALTRIRLDAADRLLRHSRCSIKQIAHRCGFASGNYFAKAYRRHRHTSPSAAREVAAGSEAARPAGPGRSAGQ
jgi:AraC-like DNA-binding protein